MMPIGKRGNKLAEWEIGLIKTMLAQEILGGKGDKQSFAKGS
jgi:hypothetical protein